MDKKYFEQGKLILRVMPIIFEHNIFALKGGTALNFFYKNLPRISVDIDLTYLKINDRKNAVKEINAELNYIKDRIRKIFGFKIQYTKSLNNSIGKLIVISDSARIKIEPSPIIRGHILSVRNIDLSKEAQNIFELNVEAKCMDEKEIIASKMVAALDRQHPRDLFDIISVVEQKKIHYKILNLFIIYALQSPRPLFEILNPNFKELEQTYKKHFIGMTLEKTDLKRLIDTREKLVKIVKQSITEDQIDFLISFYGLDPNLNLMDFKNIEKYPGIKWKITNLKKISKSKREKELDDIISYLNKKH